MLVGMENGAMNSSSGIVALLPLMHIFDTQPQSTPCQLAERKKDYILKSPQSQCIWLQQPS